MRKRKGLRAQEKDYRAITRDMQRELRLSRETQLLDALKLCLKEIEQFHSTAYPECVGGCPAHEAMSAARMAIERVR